MATCTSSPPCAESQVARANPLFFRPGTALLDDHTNLVSNETLSHLKKGTGRHSHVVLVPQPSDDPNDPLNWPKVSESKDWDEAYS